MTKQDKQQLVDELTQTLKDNQIVYLADIGNLNAKDTSDLRRACFNGKVSMKVVKNTLLKKAMENIEDKDFSGLFDTLKGNTALMTAEVGNAPAKIIKNFRKKSEKPILKSAWIEEAVFVGDENLDSLSSLKSKNELVADVVALLQSPAKNVVSALQSSKNTLAGLVKTLSEKEN